MPGIEIRKVTAKIGAQVSGVDIGKPLDEATVTALRAALDERKALVFDDVDLDDEGQQAFARHFGDLTTAHPTVPAVADAPNVLPVDSERGRAANHWHTDVTFVLNPPQASTLRSITLPPYGGETLIASSAAAYRNLPEPLRLLADTLWAEHTNDYDYAVYDGLPRRLNRVTVAGDIPVGVEGKESYSITGDASHYTSVA